MSEEIKDLPDVDLSGIVKDLDTDKGKTEVKEKVSEDLAQFKNPQELLKAYKELQGAFTKTSQEKKTLLAKIDELEIQMSLAKDTVIPNHPNFDNQYYENPQLTIQQMVLTQRKAEVLEEEQDNSDGAQDFQERYRYAQSVIQTYPNLAKTGNGVKKAFKAGDELRKRAIQESSGKLLESLFGEPLGPDEIENFKTLVKGKKKKSNNNSNAYMPDTDTSTNRMLDHEQKNDNSDKIKESAKKGDVDGVLNGMFAELMAE